MSIKPIFAWYDLWVGAFWDQSKRRLYIFPVPMFGMVIQFSAPGVIKCSACGSPYHKSWGRICPNCSGAD